MASTKQQYSSSLQISCTTTTPPPSWEVVNLVVNYLDPKSLGIASCVSKPWLTVLSSENSWKNFCITYFPSLAALKLHDPSLTYHHLFAIGASSVSGRVKSPPNPRISIENIFFNINIYSGNTNSPVITMLKPCKDFLPSLDSCFMFYVDAGGQDLTVTHDVRITWDVVLEGCGGVFNMVDVRTYQWRDLVHIELPWQGCCCVRNSSMIAAAFIMFCRESDQGGLFMVDGFTVGMFSLDWDLSCLTIDEGLRYLQHFLFPCA